ncbi:hypothetical protein [Oscillatoria sp. FACHB-1406]|uniref:hypothetical protein n=1 Tax=Oscillatoria sp. FACHB-1406 TaxID=2692846 RepID=UPI001682D9EB|nr:hypothetical protein [Oscillatoria sp. FACHB-1406]MBD2576153.1 hypothetical protein [Oscillatoria sp. FACHB-1406]
MNPINPIEAAREGDPNAIASFLQQALASEQLTVKVSVEKALLQVMLSGESTPERSLLPPLRQALQDLALTQIRQVKVYAKKSGDEFPDWEEEFAIAEGKQPKQNTPSKSGWLGAIAGAVGSAAGRAGEAAKDAAGRAGETVAGVAGAVGSAAGRAGETAKDAAGRAGETVAGVAGAVGSAAGRAGETVGGALGTTAAKAGGAMKGAASALGGTAGKLAGGTGQLLAAIDNTPGLKQLAKAFKADWLIALLDEVDAVKAQAEVEQLKQQYPNESPRAIAHRVMLQKAMLAGGSGLATSLLPGAVVPMLAIDVASTTLLQAEMVYQIAGLYGLDLEDPERKAEVLAIFGLSLGSNRALNLGLEALLRNVPIAGAVIGAGSNAAMVYALGYGACRFYEAKLNSNKPLPEALEQAKEESNDYVEDAIAQQTLMDRILAHLVRTGNPNLSREEVLAALQAANFAPASLETITAHLDAPADLEALLEQVNPDFAVPLLAQCQKIADLDSQITPEEAQILQTVKEKLNSETTRSLGLTDENE